MGIMPHKDVQKALDLALSLDIPFWPQLPNVSFHEDMYAQTARGFPGIAIDVEAKRVSFDSGKFQEELAAYSERTTDPAFFELSPEDSSVYEAFLSRELNACTAIRGQITGPVSFGFRVVDENLRPIIYDESVKTLLFDFIQRKMNAQCRQLRARNGNAFVWADEPGLGWVFSGLSGYDDVQARKEYWEFLEGLEGPPSLHLCANVNLAYLLELGTRILSFDAYQMQFMAKAYASSVADFLKQGGVICWGIVPTDSASLGIETVETLASRLEGYWAVVSQETGVAPVQIARQALIAPARCCLKNVGRVGAAGESGERPGACPISSTEEELVEGAFAVLQELSQRLVDDYRL